MTSSYGTGIAASGSKDAPSVGQSTAVIPSGACSRSRRTRSAEDEQRQGRSVLAHDHSAPVHRLYMHRLECLHGAIASVGAYLKGLPLALSQPFLALFMALLTAPFRQIFRELACSLLAGEKLEPAPERVLAKTMLATIFPYSGDRVAATPRCEAPTTRA